MEMHQIRYFLALSEELSFTQAAKQCGISQPSLTKAINMLERHLGGRLFKRRPWIALTALGRAIWPHMKQIAFEDAAGVDTELAKKSAKLAP